MAKLRGGANVDKAMQSLILKYQKDFYLNNAIPALGAVRGKMVMLNRYTSDSENTGINILKWDGFDNSNPYKGPYFIEDQYGGNQAVIQDDWTLRTSPVKINHMRTLMDDSQIKSDVEPNAQRMIMNLSSTVGGIFHGPIPYPLGVTREINNYLRTEVDYENFNKPLGWFLINCDQGSLDGHNNLARILISVNPYIVSDTYE